MYKFTDTLDGGIGLHDCRAKKLILDGRGITFVFDEGIYILSENKNNPTGEVCFTDRAEITFSDPCILAAGESCTVYLYSCTNDRRTDIREEISAQKLAEMLADGAELEFLYTYKGFRSYLFKCWLWISEEPYHRECELIISEEETLCRWNELYTEETYVYRRFLGWADKNGWTVTENGNRAPLPLSITERYSPPQEWLGFAESLDVCMNKDETVWFLTASELSSEAQGENAFGRDAFEKMSLESALDDKERAAIKAYWDAHIPIVMSVGGEYSYYAIDTATGRVVKGCEPEFEEADEAAECFDEFLCKIVTGEIVL